jgi:PAS domain-containing protein
MFQGQRPAPDAHGDHLHTGMQCQMPLSSNSTARHNGQSPAFNGDGPDRRRRLPPSTPEGYLSALPALVLLDRLAVPMLATGLDGIIVYTNAAFATMLGYQPDTLTLIGKRLPALLTGQAEISPPNCVTALRAARNVVDWVHAEGFPIRSVISESVFVRASDQIVLIGVTDITELTWTE